MAVVYICRKNDEGWSANRFMAHPNSNISAKTPALLEAQILQTAGFTSDDVKEQYFSQITPDSAVFRFDALTVSRNNYNQNSRPTDDAPPVEIERQPSSDTDGSDDGGMISLFD